MAKDPRWASWNLGVFVCIRCSGIHRGMGTHISRVKSVDLDSWTDEQMASILAWGNARANKYFEAKLAPGHVPSESKIENFIRTKYEIKRWAMEGPRPDPSTLGADGDDDVPLSVVKEKQNIERSESVRKSSGGQATMRPPPAPQADLLGGVDSAPPRASTAGPAASKQPPPKAEPAPPKATQSNSSLLGLDFFGEPSAPQRPASTTGVSTPGGGQSRPDLKQSILSLYASAPKPQSQQPQHQQQGSFGGMASPGFGHQQQSSQGGFTDAFSNLSMSNTTSPQAAPAPADPFASLGSASRSPPPTKPAQASNNSFGGLGGGSFFDSKPAQPAHQNKPSNGGFGDFGSFASPAAPVASKPAAAQSASADLFDFAAPVSTTSPSPAKPTSPPVQQQSVFNLSQPQQTSASPQQSPSKQQPAAPAFGGIGSGADVWGSSEWATPEPAPAVSTQPAAATSSSNDFGGWGSSTGGSFASTPIVPGASGGFNPLGASNPVSTPKVAADEEFGGWASSTGTSNNNTTATPKPAGGFGGADEDLFSNVWQ